MEKNEKKEVYVKKSSLFEVHLKDQMPMIQLYKRFLMLGCQKAIGEKVLLTCRELVINPSVDDLSWDIGSYLNRKHIAADKLTLGVGLVCGSGVGGNLKPSSSRKRERPQLLCIPSAKIMCPKQSNYMMIELEGGVAEYCLPFFQFQFFFVTVLYP